MARAAETTQTSRLPFRLNAQGTERDVSKACPMVCNLQANPIGSVAAYDSSLLVPHSPWEGSTTPQDPRLLLRNKQEQLQGAGRGRRVL